MAKKFKFSRFIGSDSIKLTIPISIEIVTRKTEYVEDGAPDNGYYITGEFEEIQEVEFAYKVKTIEEEILEAMAKILKEKYPGFHLRPHSKVLIGFPEKMSTRKATI